MRVFVSHSSLDEEVTTILVDLLRQALNLRSEDIRCTSIDGYRLPGGVATSQAVRSEVNEASLLIGIISPNSIRSAYVLFELGARWGLEKPMIPLLALGTRPEDLEGPLNEINVLECNNESQVHQLLNEAADHLGIKTDSPSSYINTVKKLVVASSKEVILEEDSSLERKNSSVQSTLREPEVPLLSEEARCMLVRVAKARDGVIMRLCTQGGIRFMVRGHEFNEPNSRSEALWEAALEELIADGLVRDSGNGLAFRITNLGYSIAGAVQDHLEK